MSKNGTARRSQQLSFLEDNDYSFFDSTYLGRRFDNESEESKKAKKLSPETIAFAKREGNKKGSVFYLAHSYPTKVPVEDVMAFILANTREGATVLDPFGGSGMTGLAAKLTGRNAIISDIGTLSLHLSYNHIRDCDPIKLEDAANKILGSLASEGSEYVTAIGKEKVEINYVVQSDIVLCSSCRKRFSVWEALVDQKTLETVSKSVCPKCQSPVKTSDLERIGTEDSFIAFWKEGSKRLQTTKISRAWQSSLANTRYPKVKRIPVSDIEIKAQREMYIRCALHLHEIENLSDFYTDKNLNALSRLYSKIMEVEDSRIRSALMFAFTNTAWHGSTLRRYNAHGGHRPLTGTLYIPQLRSIGNVYRIFENKIDVLKKYYHSLSAMSANGRVKLYQRSAANLKNTADNSVDYVFTDPPFGSNIFYADCNILAEAWLGRLTNTEAEAVVNKSLKAANGGKSLSDYGKLMEESFREIARVLKPSGKVHLVFNSTDGEVWATILNAIKNANLRVAQTHSLDKVQKSFKGNRSAFGKENVSTTDVIFELVKSKTAKRSVAATDKLDSKFLERAWKKYRNSRHDKNAKFQVADFYHFLVRIYSEDDLDITGLDYKEVKAFLGAS